MNPLNVVPAAAADELARWLAAREEPAYRVRQVLPRLWRRPVGAWREASDLPAALARALEEAFPLPRLRRLRQQTARDGTVKLLWGLDDGEAIESVWIPEGKRRTLCISSQAGCAFGCVFCATGRMGFRRHLEPWEIAAQVRELLLEPALGRPTNVVFMGMGEPLHNWRAVDVALTALNDADGVGIGARHLTVSTVGVLPNLAKLAARPEQFRLAVSLHAPTSERRRALMPVERKYRLPDLMAALRQFRRRVTFEYVLIAGMNDAPDDAAALAALAQPLGALVNLLPLHPGGAPGLVPATPAELARFAALVRAGGVSVSVRKSRGLDISAACGQLRVETERRGQIAPGEHADVEQEPGIRLDDHASEAQRTAHG
jgi:23S rRNA (adenine2503-C2)-methyltransferase